MRRVAAALLVLSLVACSDEGGGIIFPDAAPGEGGGGGACVSTLEAACTKAAKSQGGGLVLHCDSTLESAQKDSALCDIQGAKKVLYDCCAEAPCNGEPATYQMLAVTNGSEGFGYYYDATSGALAAVVVYESTGGNPCVAGPSSFVEPSCVPTTSTMTCPGVDGGAGD